MIHVRQHASIFASSGETEPLRPFQNSPPRPPALQDFATPSTPRVPKHGIDDMVYHGPSRGCMTCRKRKVRCDLGRPRCLNCVKRGESCPGPRLGTVATYVYRPWDPPKPARDADRKAKAILPRSDSACPPTQQYSLLSLTQDNTDSHQAQATSQRQRAEDCEVFWPLYSATTSDGTSSIPGRPPSSDPGGLAKRHALEWRRVPHDVPRAPPGGEYGNASFGKLHVDPMLHELLLFWNTSMVQPMLGTRPKGDVTDLASIAWDQLLETLWDNGYGYAFLSVAASHHKAITGSPRMRLQEARYHTIAIRHLRERLAIENDTEVAVSYVMCMLSADLASGDLSAATHHSKFLARLLQPKDKSIQSPAAISGSPYVWFEMQRATRTFTKPLVDLDMYAESLGRNTSYEQFEWTSDKTSSLDYPGLGDLGLIKLFAELRHYNAITESLDGEILPLGRAACIHLSNQLLLLHGRLLNYCVDGFSAVQYSALLSWIDRFRRAQHTAAGLAALWWFRLRTRTESAGTWSSEVDTLERLGADGAHIHALLAQMMRLSESTAKRTLLSNPENDQPTLSTLTPDFRLRLWTLYIGAVIEQTAAFPEGLPQPTYFAEQLGRYMDAAGLTEGMRAVTEMWDGFLPLDKARMYGPQWLNPVLRLWGLMY